MFSFCYNASFSIAKSSYKLHVLNAIIRTCEISFLFDPFIHFVWFVTVLPPVLVPRITDQPLDIPRTLPHLDDLTHTVPDNATYLVGMDTQSPQTHTLPPGK